MAFKSKYESSYATALRSEFVLNNFNIQQPVANPIQTFADRDTLLATFHHIMAH